MYLLWFLQKINYFLLIKLTEMIFVINVYNATVKICTISM